ncbi:tetratricopeptide repeat protein [Dawidia soli]|uniref:Tetratricopeptide repeat protein n=1 Tax=Dawidia soli TaxID=2782352 RepID=A0AAP2D929_9BACT|nr:tetratricopeptide repeat protein [Dawidia soli]MBT1687601.1 tetratricopeptide repeat protein [Dawidia soli]
MDEELEFEWIENYHKGRLSLDERQAFLEREQADAAFAGKVRSYREIMDGIAYYGKQQPFAETIRGWEQEIKTQAETDGLAAHPATTAQSTAGKKIIPLYRTYVYWAAAAVLMLIVSSVLLLRPTPADTRALYETYYRPYPDVFNPSVRGEPGTTTASAREKASAAYRAGRYPEALQLFRSLSGADRQEQDNIRLYLGNCYLALDSLDAAAKAFLSIGGDSHIASQAKWYLAMTYLKAGTADRAKSVLHTLADEGGSYADRAREILQKIE